MNIGVWVFRSHKRTVVSPDPLANCWPSGLKATESTASVWPTMIGPENWRHRGTKILNAAQL